MWLFLLPNFSYQLIIYFINLNTVCLDDIGIPFFLSPFYCAFVGWEDTLGVFPKFRFIQHLIGSL